MSNALYIAAAVMMGALVAIQPPINAVMARILDSSFLAASISISISLLVAVLVWLMWGKGDVDLAQLKELPWWVILGGMAGVIFVVGGIVVAPVLGVAMFFVYVVAGQLLGSVIVDQIGAFGIQEKPVDMMKLLGLGLVLVGAALVEHSNS